MLTCTWAKGDHKPARYGTTQTAQALREGTPAAVLEQRRASVCRGRKKY